MKKEKIKKNIKMVLLILLVIISFIIGYFFIGFQKPAENITWGVNFSQKHAESLGLDWKQTYLAILDDLGAKKLKIATHWDFIEAEQGKYYFEDLDWQIIEAEKRGAEVILVIGMKTSRWPECHIPKWAESLNNEEQQEKVLKLIEEIVLHYRDRKAIKYWQVENEPFFSFGECPPFDKRLLKKEIDLVKSLDPVRDSGDKEKAQKEQISNGVDSPKRPIIISESGEFSFWTRAAKAGDIVGTTIYRRIWSKEFKVYVTHIFPATFYHRKAKLIKWIFNKEVICIELQAEPWGPKLLYDLPLEEQEKSMDLERFQKNIKFAKKTGLNEFYLWGTEWWYWLKEKQNKPEIWNQAKKLF